MLQLPRPAVQLTAGRHAQHATTGYADMQSIVKPIAIDAAGNATVLELRRTAVQRSTGRDSTKGAPGRGINIDVAEGGRTLLVPRPQNSSSGFSSSCVLGGWDQASQHAIQQSQCAYAAVWLYTCSCCSHHCNGLIGCCNAQH